MRAPGRRVSWTTWPSTHRTDIFSTYSAILMLSSRTGHGCSGVVSAAFSGRGGGVVTDATLGAGADAGPRTTPRLGRARGRRTASPLSAEVPDFGPTACV